MIFFQGPYFSMSFFKWYFYCWQEWIRRAAGETWIISCWHPSRAASGATHDNPVPVDFWCLFCFSLAFLPQLVLTPLTHSPHCSGSRGVRSHLCTHVHCTVGVSSLTFSIVWSALTNTQHSFLHSLCITGKPIRQAGWEIRADLSGLEGTDSIRFFCEEDFGQYCQHQHCPFSCLEEREACAPQMHNAKLGESSCKLLNLIRIH